ncbi:dol-P-Man:Man(5)GlcNAc(2)-PP-Dol alpha-1,3-mannosyltransferase isoform X2 [Amborella trichopoda]|uniref:dol-P-Man:Man(5)GlcNAc(2)-PP-Dol alpha-1,3-mannosyltransferase isoform X2 n=1 Tax=Amborella trichopoda TaxID=13333 RepID=UPI0005D4216F|nr:dol-P-Man:Man(5)GlcNAc(2)-PP-Dol alpha-1,3-mannosyltransferase isoform X2 [Amborella trichopoda]|eukprot:XP_011621915.1 dol-P-Man:Man(5)GlcNAc(2)-PP-Dol alpha-1,3-mannosyltransferase isoform X2 [Amborella trichopoda]
MGEAAARRFVKQETRTLPANPGCFKSRKVVVSCVLLGFESLLLSLIIAYVPYTKIDWDAYMSQVSGFLAGERDYRNLKGDTGPLVYPAGFLYVYSAVQFVTGGEVFPAQILFGVLYITNLAMIFLIYNKTNVLPWWALCLLCLSRRIHSIFVLRLFNDCFAMTLLHAAIALLLYRRWHLAMIIFSAAVSIKMNVLLCAPPLFLMLLKILFGLPFLLVNPTAYISRAFDLGRVFIHFWSVNFKFVPEAIFTSKKFAISLLVVHLILLACFAHYKWCKYEGGLPHLLLSKFVTMKHSRFDPNNSHSKILNNDHIVTTIFVGNFIGIICARSLHYQFYSWYFYSLPFMLWKTSFPIIIRLILFAGVEVCWNIYPSNVYSSPLLLFIHLTILWGLWITPCEYPYKENKDSQTKEA